MKLKPTKFLVGLMLASSAFFNNQVSAQSLDQSVTVTGPMEMAIAVSPIYGQTFVPSFSSDLVAIDLDLRLNTGGCGGGEVTTITVRIYDSYGTGGTILATSTPVGVSNQNYQPGMVHFVFPSPPALSAGTSYSIFPYASSQPCIFANVFWHTSLLNPYIYGEFITNTGSQPAGGNEDAAFGTYMSCTPVLWYHDGDIDGYDDGSPVSSCSSPGVGYDTGTLGTDCDDNNNLIHSNQTFYVDNDGDGYGSSTTSSICALTPPSGYSSNSSDCDDNNSTKNPHGIPQNISTPTVNAHNAIITWVDGSCSNVFHYILRTRPVGSSTWTYAHFGSNTLQKNLTGLAAYTTYELQMQSGFTVDSSAWSSLVNFTTLCDGVVSANYSNVTNSTVDISWTGGSYGSHLIQYRSNHTHVISRVVVPANQSSITLTGLTPGYTYSFRVATKCGNGTNSAFTSIMSFNCPLRLANPDLNLNNESAAIIAASIYPNPGTGIFELSGTTNFEGSLNILVQDITGRTVLSQSLSVDGNDFKQTIDLSNETAGMYVVYLTGEDGATQMLKLIKQ